MKADTMAWIAIAAAAAIVLLGVNIADSKETTTLDEAVDRPTKIERYIDKQNGVACYWNTRHPAYLTCVKVTNTRKLYVTGD